MADLDKLLKPTFEQRKDGTVRSAGERDDAAAITTYRYLRLGIVMVVVALVASVMIQRSNAGCWQGSISAYYYSPARAMFVSGMVAIGILLIIIKGSTVIEDTLLNFAGMLAPIVAFVPTTYEAACVPGQALPKGTGAALPASIVSDVHNNIEALLIAATTAIVVALLIFGIDELRRGEDGTTVHVWSRLIVLGTGSVVVAFGWWLWATDRILDYHGWSASAMFAFLALASICNGVWLFQVNRGSGPRTSPHWWVLASLYTGIGLMMVIVGCIINYVVPDPWDHRTLVLEMTEIGLFGALWVVQSIERWGRIIQARPAP